MYMKISNIMFSISIIMSTMMIVSTSSWLMAWISLEFNLMVLIPLLIYKINFKTSSASIKYFLIQAIASIIMFLSIFMISKVTLMSMYNNNDMISIALAMKLGMAPFQFWVPQVIEMINMIKVMLILVWQKIAPMILLLYSTSNLIILMMTINLLLGSFGGLNQNSIKKILFYSSLVHLSWMINSLMISEKMWISYLMIYMTILIPMMAQFNCLKIKSINKTTSIKTQEKIILFLSIMSLAGMPPLLGFYPKVMVIFYNTMNIFLYPLIIMLIMSSLISMYYYFKLCWSILIANASTNKFSNKKKMKNKTMLTLTTMMTSGVPLMVMMI